MNPEEPKGEMNLENVQGHAFGSLPMETPVFYWKCGTHGGYDPRCPECIRLEERERCREALEVARQCIRERCLESLIPPDEGVQLGYTGIAGKAMEMIDATLHDPPESHDSTER